MRVVLPSGKIRKVSSVTPCCEKGMFLNGRQVIFKENAMAIKYARGIKISFECDHENIFENNPLYVGNLSNAMVREIMKKFIEQEFFDFSSLDYQKVSQIKDINFDSELPYHSEGNPFLGCVDVRMNNYMPSVYSDCGADTLQNDDIFETDDGEWDELDEE